jgi:MraZ protein
MTGEYQHSIDTKGRLFIPAKLREELGDTFYVTISFEKCLTVYSDDNWANFTAKFNSLPYSKTKAMRPIFAKAAKCELDAQGRILLPQNLRQIAGLKKDVTVVGVSNHAEIWDTASWLKLEQEELDPQKLAAVMDELGF